MAVKTTVELTDLVGAGKLDAVDFGTESRKRWNDDYEDCQVCRFRLNGTVYVAVEDPDDGYRSNLGELLVQRGAKLSNVFQKCKVVGVYREGDWRRKKDIVEFIDTTTGKVVLEIGTDNTDDYYPSFVASFHPENMASNVGVAA